MPRRPYQEGPDSTFGHNGKTYRLDTLFKCTYRRLNNMVAIDKLVWVLDHCTPDPERMAAANDHIPILVTYTEGRWVVVDGLHRLARAVAVGRKIILAKYVLPKDLDAALITQGSSDAH